MIHFDTSSLIHALLPSSGADRRLRRWLRQGEELAISTISWAEFLRGPVGPDAADTARELFGQIVPFADDRHAVRPRPPVPARPASNA